MIYGVITHWPHFGMANSLKVRRQQMELALLDISRIARFLSFFTSLNPLMLETCVKRFCNKCTFLLENNVLIWVLSFGYRRFSKNSKYAFISSVQCFIGLSNHVVLSSFNSALKNFRFQQSFLDFFFGFCFLIWQFLFEYFFELLFFYLSSCNFALGLLYDQLHQT